YLRAIASALAKGKRALVLVPEISLTSQLAARFRGRFGSQVAVLHSGLTDAERKDAHRRIHEGEVAIALGGVRARREIGAGDRRRGARLVLQAGGGSALSRARCGAAACARGRRGG